MLPPPDLADRHGGPAADLWALDPAVLHLNHGSFGAVPRAALVHQAELKAEMEASPVRWFSSLPPRLATARLEIASFLGSSPEGTALVPNASAGITVVLNSLELEPGAELIVTDHTYGAVRMAAERAARRVRGQVVVVEIPLHAEGAEVVDAVRARMTPRTAVLIIDAITSPTARRFPIPALTDLCRERQVVSIVDGAHAPGVLTEPVEPADYWGGTLHKFGCAPRGTAALVTTPERGQRLFPLIDSWGANDPFPERFDYQGTVDATAWLAAPGALRHLEERVSWQELRRHAAQMVAWGAHYIADQVRGLTGEGEVVVPAMAADTMRLIRLPRWVARTRRSADGRRDLLAARYGTEVAVTTFAGVPYLRLSAHGYTTAEQIIEFCRGPVQALVGEHSDITV